MPCTCQTSCSRMIITLIIYYYPILWVPWVLHLAENSVADHNLDYLPLSTCTDILQLSGKCLADHNLDYIPLSTCMHWGPSCSCGTSLKLIITLITYRCPLTLGPVLQLWDQSIADHNLDYLPLSTCMHWGPSCSCRTSLKLIITLITYRCPLTLVSVLQLSDKSVADHNLDYLPLSTCTGVLQLSDKCISVHNLDYLPLSPHMDTRILWVLQLSEKSAADHNLDYLPLSPHFGTVDLEQLSDDSVTHHHLDYLPLSTCMYWCLSCICRSSL